MNILNGASTHNEINTLFRGENKELAQNLIKLVYEFEDYWPMTLRAFYYQAVSALLVQNNNKQYKRVGNVLKKLRRNELLPWYIMEDKTRTTSDKRGIQNVKAYIERDFEEFLKPEYYQRCYIQKQPVYVEITVEKDALVNHVKNAAWMYCTRVSVTRGQPSATMVNNIAERFDKAIMKGLSPILIHLGDLDPSGVQIPKSMKRLFLEYHSLDIDVRQISLTPEQCVKHNLPQTFDAAKEDDPNIKRWYEEYGNQPPTELDALHPEKLKELVTESLSNIYDMGEVDEQRQAEIKERNLLVRMRKKAVNFFRSEYPDYMEGISA